MGDDTMLNGVILRCSKPFTEEYEDITLHEGLWGDWGGMKEAPANEFVSSFVLRL